MPLLKIIWNTLLTIQPLILYTCKLEKNFRILVLAPCTAILIFLQIWVRPSKSLLLMGGTASMDGLILTTMLYVVPAARSTTSRWMSSIHNPSQSMPTDILMELLSLTRLCSVEFVKNVKISWNIPWRKSPIKIFFLRILTKDIIQNIINSG